MFEHPVSIQKIPEKLREFCSRDTPQKKKMMAAAGMLPFDPSETATVLYVLSYDENDQINKKASATLLNLPDRVILEALAQISDETVLDGLSQLLIRKLNCVEKIVLNMATSPHTVHYVVLNVKNEKLLEIVAANEQRMLKHPVIIEALYFNKTCRMSTADRAIELAIRNKITLNGIENFDEIKAALSDELIFEATDEPSPDDILFSNNEKMGQDLKAEQVDKFIAFREDGEEFDDELTEEVEEKVQDMENSISNMTISQKIRLACLGNTSQRAVLIRDSNKLVIMSVLKSPTVGESEAAKFSKYRTLPEEALRYISKKKEWTKKYQIKLNLVQNPRTPIDAAMKFLNHLRPNDVRSLEKDKNIPQAIARAAKRLRQKRSP